MLVFGEGAPYNFLGTLTNRGLLALFRLLVVPPVVLWDLAFPKAQSQGQWIKREGRQT